jgi:ankyrin repeat protein
MSSIEDLLIDVIIENDKSRASWLISSQSVRSFLSKPLKDAALLGRVEIMTMLLDAGVDIDAVDEKNSNRGASYYAVLHNHFAAVKLLLDRGSQTIRSGAMVELAMRNTNSDPILMLLLDAGAPIDSLTMHDVTHLAAVRSIAFIPRLLARNVDFSALQDRRCYSPCHIVAQQVSRPVVERLRALVDAGVDVDAVDDRGETALHCAARCYNMPAIRMLVELGADVDRQATSDGRTALLQLRDSSTGYRSRLNSQQQTDCCELLLALGANVHLADNQGQTVCHWAARFFVSDPLFLCLAAGGDLDQPDIDGDAPRKFVQWNFAPSVITTFGKVIDKTRLDLVRHRALEICIALQSFNLDALRLCLIMMNSFGAIGSLIAFHQWWKIATTVKHFHSHTAQNH